MKKLSVILSVAAFALPGTAMAASCPTNFEFTNASSKDAIITIHSKTRLNATWTPNILNPSASQANQIMEVAADGVRTYSKLSGKAIPVDQVEPTAKKALGLVYDIRKANMKARTFVIKANARAANAPVSLPVTCKMKRQYTFAVYCGTGRKYFDRIGYNDYRTVRRTICQ
ncbi:MAG: hypothetical protein H6918_05115 [Sphingomonadaceae bacterium]|nr:hypothetical protein [Sphingomonadaceae bacterium]